MKYYIVNSAPTREQVDAIEAQVVLGRTLNMDEGTYIIAYDNNEYRLPDWLEGAEELQMPVLLTDDEVETCSECGGRGVVPKGE